ICVFPYVMNCFINFKFIFILYWRKFFASILITHPKISELIFN
ncbi:hypothetical protein, partial [Plasmodium yoelii yoelii]